MTVTVEASGRGSSAQRSVLIGFAFLVAVGPWVKELTAQPAARVALTAAIVDHGTIRLDGYEDVVFVDRVERDGHLYSDKAPGQPLWAIPFYAVERAVGAEPASHSRLDGNLTLWWVTLWSATVPGAVLVALVHQLLRRRVAPWSAAFGAVAVGCGSLLLPFSAELYGHVLATAAAYGAWMLVRAPSPSRRAVVAAGALVGWCVLIEYQMVLLALVLLVLVAVRQRARVLWFALAGAPFAAVLLAYQDAAFGSPFRSSYGEKPGASVAVLGAPSPRQALEVLFGDRGIFVFTPIVLLGVVGLWMAARDRRSALRLDGVVGLAVFGAYLALQSGWGNPWGGEMPGPRYLIPALPFVAAGVAVVHQRAARLTSAVLAVSVVTMAFPLITLHLVPEGGVPVAAHLENIRTFGFSPTVWTLLAGDAGWAVHLVTVVGATWLAWRSSDGQDPASAELAAHR